MRIEYILLILYLLFIICLCIWLYFMFSLNTIKHAKKGKYKKEIDAIIDKNSWVGVQR